MNINETYRLVEAEALGGVGQDVGVELVRGKRVQLATWTFGKAKACMMQPNHANMDNLQVLQFRSSTFRVTRFGQGQRVESATRGDILDGEFVKDRSTMPVLVVTAPPTKMVSIKTFQKDG